MRVTRYSCLTDTTPQILTCTWHEFAQGFGPHDYSYGPKAKEQGALPMFSPADYPPGLTRKDEHATSIAFGVLDIEHVNAEQLLGVITKLEGLNAFLYTSWNHSKDFHALNQWRVRICVEFSRALDPREWRLFWPRFANHFGGVCDPKCKAISMAYYGPFAPPGTEQDQHWVIWHGSPLDVDSLQGTPFVPVQGTERIARDRLERLYQRWRRSKDDWRATMGEALKRVTLGEPYAESGERDTRTFQLCQDLAEQFPTAVPESIAAHFAQSLQIMGPDAPTVEQVADKIRRAQTAKAQTHAEEQESLLTEQKLRMRQAFAPTDPTRDWPYTDTELEAFAAKLRIDRQELGKRWLIQRGNLFYVLGPGARYSDAYTDKDVMNAIVRDLAPARTAGVELYYPSDDGIPQRKQLQQLMSDYGTVATNYVLDLRAQETTYETFQRLMVEAPCPLRPLTSLYDHDVARWLEFLAGDRLPGLLSWLALATDLDSTCVALLLTGPPDTGKSLFAHGVSRLYRTAGPVPMTSAMDPSFNAALAKCPIVFADEQLPKDFRGYGRTSELREFIAARTRPFKQKFYPESVILGATRLVIAANNEDILAINENLTVNDIEAIADRFYHVKVSLDAATWLQCLGQSAAETIVTEDRLARHVLWLKDNYPVQRQGRFLIKAPDRSFVRALTTKTGIRSSVCQWLVGYLREPARVDSAKDWRIRISRGRFLVTAKGILDTWQLYVPNVAVPETGRLNTAIVGLSKPDSRPHVTFPGGARNYREIDIDHIIAWAAETEYATPKEIKGWLTEDTESRIKILSRLLN